MFPGTSSANDKVRIFVSYDCEHDGDLLELITEQAARPTAGFEIADRSRKGLAHGSDAAGLRHAIRTSEQVVVICGEHSGASAQMRAELIIAQEEQRPYLLLWGRRDPMCTRPEGAKATDSMYGWTEEGLQHQIQNLRRLTRADAQREERQREKAAAQAAARATSTHPPEA